MDETTPARRAVFDERRSFESRVRRASDEELAEMKRINSQQANALGAVNVGGVATTVTGFGARAARAHDPKGRFNGKIVEFGAGPMVSRLAARMGPFGAAATAVGIYAGHVVGAQRDAIHA